MARRQKACEHKRREDIIRKRERENRVKELEVCSSSGIVKRAKLERPVRHTIA